MSVTIHLDTNPGARIAKPRLRPLPETRRINGYLWTAVAFGALGWGVGLLCGAML